MEDWTRETGSPDWLWGALQRLRLVSCIRLSAEIKENNQRNISVIITLLGCQLGRLRGFLSVLSCSLVLVLGLDCRPSLELSRTISAVEAEGLLSVLGTKLNF